MNMMPELAELIRYVVQRTDRTIRFCLILFCLGAFSTSVLTLAFVALMGVVRR